MGLGGDFNLKICSDEGVVNAFVLFVMGVGAQCFITDESDMLSFGFRWCVRDCHEILCILLAFGGGGVGGGGGEGRWIVLSANILV